MTTSSVSISARGAVSSQNGEETHARVVHRLPIDLNLVRAWAVFGVVFYHTLDMFCLSHGAKTMVHMLLGMPSLTVLLLFSGMTMGIYPMPASVRGYLKYLRQYASGHLRVYTVFFVAQTAITIVYYYYVDGPKEGMGHGPLNLGQIVVAYVLASGRGSLGIWYMHMLALAVAVWPLTSLVRRIPVWIVFLGLLGMGYCAGYLAPAGLSYVVSRFCYCIAALYLGQRVTSLRNGDHRRRVWGFGLLYGATGALFLVLLATRMLPSYRAFPLHGDMTEAHRVMSYGIAMASRLCGACFFISAIGIVGARCSILRVYFSRAAHSSYYVYLMHRAVHYACPLIVRNGTRQILVSWTLFPQILFAFFSTMVVVTIGYYAWGLARHHAWLDYWVFGKGQRPQCRRGM